MRKSRSAATLGPLEKTIKLRIKARKESGWDSSASATAMQKAIWRHSAAIRSFMRSSDMLKRMKPGFAGVASFPVMQACGALSVEELLEKSNAILVETEVETILPAAKLCIDA